MVLDVFRPYNFTQLLYVFAYFLSKVSELSGIFFAYFWRSKVARNPMELIAEFPFALPTELHHYTIAYARSGHF